MEDERITLAHGNGGRFMRELIEDVFARHLGGVGLDVEADAVPIQLNGGEVMITTDGFTVQPLEFPGGDIGSLAVHGTVNDLAVAGARARYLTLNAFIEEGFEIETLQRIVRSLAVAAKDAGVTVAAGDTKVLRRGEGGGLYLATTGVGERLPGARPAMSRIAEGDVVLVSGTVGDHGAAVMLAREDFGLSGELVSDSAPVSLLTEALLPLRGLKFMRDPTRGGIASVAHEIVRATGFGVRFTAPIPVRDTVQSICDMLGYDPCYLASEGRVVAVLAPADAERALDAWRALPQGRDAVRVGCISGRPGHVVLETALGGDRFIEELEDDPLPRIC